MSTTFVKEALDKMLADKSVKLSNVQTLENIIKATRSELDSEYSEVTRFTRFWSEVKSIVISDSKALMASKYLKMANDIIATLDSENGKNVFPEFAVFAVGHVYWNVTAIREYCEKIKILNQASLDLFYLRTATVVGDKQLAVARIPTWSQVTTSETESA